LAKKYLIGLRENALIALRDQGMLVKPIEHVLHENVFPWMLEKMAEFLIEDDFVDINLDDLVRDAFEAVNQKHASAKDQER
jgi:Radial spoke protein 3